MRIILTILFLWVLSANATNYYVASAGSNANNGTSTGTPFQTIAKVISVVAKHDSVFLNRGDSWNEKFTVPFDSLYFGAYGSGNKPIITGLQTLSGFTNTSGNIWSATATNSVRYENTVLIGGQIRAKGRYPNTSYLRSNNSATTQYRLVGTGFTGTPNYTGGELVTRGRAGYNWVIDVNKISSQSVDTLNLATPTTYQVYDLLFFVQNIPSVLDLQNEWCIDSTSKLLSIYSVGSPTVQISTIDTLINLFKRSYITFDGLNITGANAVGICLDSTKYITVQNCTINNIGGVNTLPLTFGGQGGAGIRGENATHTTVKNDSILNCLNNGIFTIHTCDSSTIDNNYIKNSGNLAGMGNSGNGAYNGVFQQGLNTVITNNRVDSIGYNGLDFNGTNSLIYRNYVTNFCFLKNDGGGIYTVDGAGTSTGSIIRSNFAFNGVDTVTNGDAPGIYCDNDTHDVFVDSNTVSNCSLYGIFFGTNRFMSITNNTVYDSIGIPLTILGDGTYYPGFTNTNIKYNIFYSKNSANPVYKMNSATIGTMDSNYIMRPVLPSNLIWDYGINAYYNIATWYTHSGFDQHSQGAPTGISGAGTLYYNATTSATTQTFTGRKVDSKGHVYFSNTPITIQPFGSVILFDIPSNYSKKIGAFLFN